MLPRSYPIAQAKRLTVAAVDRLRPPERGRSEHFDNLVPGLALRVTTRGSKSWTFIYRIDGRSRRLTFGPYPAVSLDQARDLAREAWLKVARSEDPALAMADERSDARRQRQNTMACVIDEFINGYRRKRNSPQTASQSESLLRRHALPKWRNLPISEIKRRDVIALLDEAYDERQPYIVLNLHKELRKLFAWAVDTELIEANPASRYQSPFVPKSRDRVLTDGELAAIWQATGVMGYPMGSLYRLLLLTGQRRSEAARATWNHFDLASGVWTIPRDLSKSDRAHNVPLAPMVVDWLLGLPTFSGSYVFSTTGGTKPVSGFSKAKSRADELSGIADWRVHDLRRTVASGMARLGVQTHTLSRVLNHAPSNAEGVTAIYNRYGYDEDKRQALLEWSQHVEAITSNARG